MALTKIITNTIDLSSDTTALKMPKGTTTERQIQYLVVAGGGGGAGNSSGGGGGGAGGVLSGTTNMTASTNLTITVGAGGAGTTNETSAAVGGNGGNSVFGNITATGGGGAGNTGAGNSANGGSGGGASGGTAVTPGNGIPQQGNNGGTGSNPSDIGGGGGGAGGVGQPGGNLSFTGTDGQGGAAISNSITGTATLYAGGGGGGVCDFVYNTGTPATTGLGGAGIAGTGGNGGQSDGSTSAFVDGGNGTANTGGGGGGGSRSAGSCPGADCSSGGDGGSGIVILRYASKYTLVNNTPGTLTTGVLNGTVGDDKYTTFTAGTGTISGLSFDLEIGAMRENTTTGKMEIYTGAKGWRALQQTGQDVGIVPSNNFNVSIWSGNSSNQTISGVGFSGDLTFLKNRTGANNWFALDTVRGPATNLNLLYTDLTNAQDTSVGSTFFQQFNSDGYSLGSSVYNNATGNDYVGYTWKGGGAATTITAGTVNSNTVDSNVSANTEAGFSIVSYTAPSSGVVRIAHGLGGVPDMVITKTYSVAGYNWYTWVKGFDTTSGYVYLDGSAGDSVSSGYNMWNNGFTSTTYEQNVGYSTIAGASTIGYLWRSIPGYSLIGSYTGTGSATDTPIIYTGFEPAWIMIKRTDATANWRILDNKRSPTNPINKELYPNLINAEGTYTSLNFYSNGFQLINSDASYNAAGGDYIFMCFAS